jgi:hypothetical protein
MKLPDKISSTRSHVLFMKRAVIIALYAAILMASPDLASAQAVRAGGSFEKQRATYVPRASEFYVKPALRPARPKLSSEGESYLKSAPVYGEPAPALERAPSP